MSAKRYNGTCAAIAIGAIIWAVVIWIVCAA